MVGEEEGYQEQNYIDPLVKLRDIEEKQRILKDRLLLVGQNLIETKEKQEQKIINMKKDIETIKQDLTRIKSFIETLSTEFSKFAKKEDLEILTKQAKMFQPLEFVRKSDLEKLKNEVN
ncbi:MAG: hypothetical protein OQK82_04035 [Candidatus Pacearchaeota archaeon]|nr:hypothetical protein [Candidatus Pacearchaeota archaeon]